MEYNPFTQNYKSLNLDLYDKENEKISLSDQLKWFDSTDISSLSDSLEKMKKSKKNDKSLINSIEKEIERLNTDIQENKKIIKTLFNPFNWVDDDQKSYRKKLKGLKIELNKKKDNKECRKKSLSETEKSIKKIKLDIKRYKNFDRQKVNEELNKLDEEIVLLEEEFKRVSDLKMNTDSTLQPVIKQIEDYESRIRSAKEKISKAESFERALENAYNSYERAMVHQECDLSFGEDKPRKIIKRQERMIRDFERNLEKAKERAILIGKNALRDIKNLVIDGNNMCYEDNKFVGLDPLIKSTVELQKNYKIIIIFDSAIRSQVQANDQRIREKFDSRIKIHIVATKQLADETILDVASNDDLYYILSNDRFGEYAEKEVVRNNRLIRHEIVGGKVIIHDLNLNIRYV